MMTLEEMQRLATEANGTLVHGWGSPVKVDSLYLEQYTRWVIEEVTYRLKKDEEELEDE